MIGCQDGSTLQPDDDGRWTRRWGDERDHPRLRIVRITEKEALKEKTEMNDTEFSELKLAGDDRAGASEMART